MKIESKSDFICKHIGFLGDGIKDVVILILQKKWGDITNTYF
jgi:hypothetical protein